MRHRRTVAALALVVLALLGVHACGGSDPTSPGDDPPDDPPEPTTEHTLSLNGTGDGAGTVTSSPSGIDCTVEDGSRSGQCTSDFDEGTSVSLSASSGSASSFMGWAGACDGESCSVTMNGDRQVTAAFEEQDPPASPSGLQASPAGTGSIEVSWTDNSGNEQGFRIEQKLSAEGSSAWSQVGEVGADTESFTDDGLAPGTSYDYRVRACNAAGCSSYSDVASATTGTEETAPSAPSSLTATATGTGTIDLAWTDNATDEDGYRVERKRSSEGSAAWSEVAQLGADVESYSDTGLSPSTGYDYRVRACNAAGCSSYSNTASATTDEEQTAPSAPSGLTATAAGTSTIDLAWTDNSGDEESFRVERKRGSQGSASWSEVARLASNTTSFSDTGLSPSTGYDYRVRACNAVGCSSYSNTASATTDAEQTAPAAPSGLVTTSSGSDAALLNWTDNSGDEDDFRVERKRSSEGSLAWSEVAQLGANTESYTDSGLEAATSYDYRVRACNAQGCSAFSNVASVTTSDEAAVPTAPTGLTATATGSSTIELDWTDNSGNEDSFRIERKLGSEGSAAWSEVGSLDANLTGVTVTDLDPSTTYDFRVRACNSEGCSSYSNTASATTDAAETPPTAPSGVDAVATSSSSIDLSWNDTNNEDSYEWQQKLSSEDSSGWSDRRIQGADNTDVTITGLTPSTSYDFRVRACNAAGCSSYSNTASATTDAEQTAPAAPTSLGATAAGPGTIDLAWTDNATDEDGYRVERKLGSEGSAAWSEVAQLGADVESYSDSGLSPSTGYDYRVRACNVAGCSSYSNTASATTDSELSIDTSSLPVAIEGSAYEESLNASGGDGSYTWSISSGSLPDGLDLSPSTGTISGEASSNDASFTVQVSDGNNSTDTQDLTLEVWMRPNPTIEQPDRDEMVEQMGAEFTPSLQITDTWVEDEAVPFEASATDPDGQTTFDFEWVSSIDGDLLAQQAFEMELSVGDHNIFLNATDSDGVTGSTLKGIDILSTVKRLAVSVHPDISYSQSRVTSVLSGATNIVNTDDGTGSVGGDVACNLTLQLDGSVGTPPSDVEAIIDSEQDLQAAFDAPANIVVVEDIQYCTGEDGENPIGCGLVGGDDFVVEPVSGSTTEAITWAHEFGHNTGLRHRPETEYIMTGAGAAPDQTMLTPNECTFLRYYSVP